MATIDGVTVVQTVTPYLNPTTGRADSAKISYTMTNTTSAAHSVGVRSLIDTYVNDNDDAPFRVPGGEPVLNENTWIGAQIPSSFLVFDTLEDVKHVAEARFRGPGLTVPDRIQSASWQTAKRATEWNYVTTPTEEMGDSALLAYYDPVRLAPGQSRTVAFAYGAGDASATLGSALNAGLTGPKSLEAAGADTYAPNPFDVVGTAENAGERELTNVTMRLDLPEGLSTSDPVTVNAGSLAVGSSGAQHTWRVMAAPSSTARTLTYKLVVSAPGVADQVVTREVTIPALAGAPAPSPSETSPSPTSSSPSTSASPTSSAPSDSSPTSSVPSDSSPTSSAPTSSSPTTHPTHPSGPGTTAAPVPGTSAAPVPGTPAPSGTGPKVDTDGRGQGSGPSPVDLGLTALGVGIAVTAVTAARRTRRNN